MESYFHGVWLSLKHSLPCLTDTNTKHLTHNSLRVIFVVLKQFRLCQGQRRRKAREDGNGQGVMYGSACIFKPFILQAVSLRKCWSNCRQGTPSFLSASNSLCQIRWAAKLVPLQCSLIHAQNIPVAQKVAKLQSILRAPAYILHYL